MGFLEGDSWQQSIQSLERILSGHFSPLTTPLPLTRFSARSAHMLRWELLVVQLLMQGKRRQRSDRLHRGAWRCMQRSSIDRFLNCKLHHHLWICEILNTKSRKLQILKNLKMWKRHETVRVLRIFFGFCGMQFVEGFVVLSWSVCREWKNYGSFTPGCISSKIFWVSIAF